MNNVECLVLSAECLVVKDLTLKTKHSKLKLGVYFGT